MTERQFRIIVGALLLAALYFDLSAVIWSIIGIFLFQGITNWRIPRIVSRLRHGRSAGRPAGGATCRIALGGHITFESERALCLLVGAFLLITYGVFGDQLWFLTWFVSFALFAAGLSGVCPMVIGLRSLGLR